MIGSDRLSTRQRRFIASLLSASSIREAAEAAELSEPTAYRYLAVGGVKRELARRQEAILSQVGARMVSDAMVARDALLLVIGNDEVAPGTRVRACQVVLDVVLRMYEVLSLSERVRQLEEVIGEREW